MNTKNWYEWADNFFCDQADILIGFTSALLKWLTKEGLPLVFAGLGYFSTALPDNVERVANEISGSSDSIQSRIELLHSEIEGISSVLSSMVVQLDSIADGELHQ